MSELTTKTLLRKAITSLTLGDKLNLADTIDIKITDLVDDLTPQLGGDLDLNSKNIDFPTTANISDCLDDDTMATASATTLATSESIKAYVDSIGSKSTLVFQAPLDYTGGTTEFYGVGVQNTSRAEVQFQMPFACNIKNMRAAVTTTPGGAESVAFTLMNEGADSTLTCTITTGTSANDLVNIHAETAGGFISLKIVPSASAAGARAKVVVEVEST